LCLLVRPFPPPIRKKMCGGEATNPSVNVKVPCEARNQTDPPNSPPQPTRRAAIPAAAARTPCPDLRPVRVRTQHQQPPEPANDPSPIQASPSPPSEERGDGAVMAPHNHNHNHNHNPVLFCFCFLFLVCCISLLTAPCSPDVLCAAGAPAGHVVALSGAGPLARRRGALHSNGGCYMLYLQSLYLLPVSGFVFDPCWAL